MVENDPAVSARNFRFVVWVADFRGVLPDCPFFTGAFGGYRRARPARVKAHAGRRIMGPVPV